MASFLNNSDGFVNGTLKLLVSDADYAAVELYKGYPDGLLKFAAACCIIFMMIGIPGNVITIVALASYKRVHNATAIFIMNLTCSDLLFCCFTPPLTTSTFLNRSWIHGRVLCRMYPPIRYILTTVSVISILAITINRYVIIVYPRLYCKIYQKRNLVIMLAVIWFLPLLALMPTCLGKWGRFDLDQENGSCSIVIDENNRSGKKFLFSAAIGLPCILIILCYARIFFIVRNATKKPKKSKLNKNSQGSSTEDSTTRDTSSITVRVTAFSSVISDSNDERGKDIPMKVMNSLKTEHSTSSTVDTTDEPTYNIEEAELEEPPKLRRHNVLKRSIALLKISLPTRKDKRLGTMILAIMTSFCLCHFPIVIIKVIRWLNPHPAVNISAHIFLYMSTCINPIIYVVMSTEYQKAYKNLFRRRSSTFLIQNDA